MLLSLDLGTKTGYCAGDHAMQMSGVADFKPRRHEGGGMRLLRFKRWLDACHAADAVTEVVYEEVRRHRGVDAAHVYGGLMGVLTSWCEEHSIPYRGVPVGTIKKFATDNGAASKEQVIAAVRSWGHEPADDNEADAIALFWQVVAETTGIMPQVRTTS